jgi:excinuclease ABC subunit A
MQDDFIRIRGAREHNLKNINLDIPRNKLVVITGISGSGKSSLAFDTIYAEGQRKYLESLSAYARQFIGELRKPNVDHIDGLSPSIAITQHSGSKNPRSTVGTMTEVYDYLRLLFARIGIPHCPNCGKEIKSQSLDQIIERVMLSFNNKMIQIVAPIVREKKGEFKNLFSDLQVKGYVKVIVDDNLYDVDDEIILKKTEKHSISVIIDQLTVEESERPRIADSIEQALELADGIIEIRANIENKWEVQIFSEKFACPECGISISEIEPRLFSFNSPFGACPECNGLGIINEVSPSLIIKDPEKSIIDGAIDIPGFRSYTESYTLSLIERVLERYGESLDTPFKLLKKETKNAILYGDRYYEGIINTIKRRYSETDSEMMLWEYEKLMVKKRCPSCNGTRLKKEALAVTINGKNIADLCDMSLRNLLQFFETLKLTENEKLIADRILKEISLRLTFIIDVGLDYLSLSRDSATLSGGEAQRLRLASQVGSGLVGVLYVLDEPSIGLHSKDNEKLLKTLFKLRDLGNTVIVVEHDENTIRSADFIVDVGPGAGNNGGEVVVSGKLEDVISEERSVTGRFLSGKEFISIPESRRKGNGKTLKVSGVREHNLKNISVSFNLGKFICITGVSGSGKSTLINDVLYRVLASILYKSKEAPGEYDKISGVENIKKVIIVDQNPIGRTPRSNPATYIGLWTDIRQIFASLPESKMRGYTISRFSFNVKGGRCEACMGDGLKKVEMQFLPDVYIPCEVCEGKRFNKETLLIRYKGYNIYDVLDMTADDAFELFKNYPTARRKLELLRDVGLGYVKLGQFSTTLSGGEAQRIKLALELSKKSEGKTLYILDEPTTGLHFADIKRLLEVLNKLVDKGNTVIVIEHNLDVIKSSDYIIDLGPGGGDYGGYVVAKGTPEEVAKNENSYTGMYLKEVLKKEKIFA